MNDLPQEVKKLIEHGYDRNYKTNVHTHEFDRMRTLSRKWRNLISEARFDIPGCLHQYINWGMPESWDVVKPQRIHAHNFLIKIPDFRPVAIIYRSLGMSEWLFDRFEIISVNNSPVSSNKYDDLPLFLAMACELNRPKKKKVTVEEIDGGLADNAKLIRVSEVKQKDSYVLARSDFWNNPDADEGGDNPYSDMAIYA